jgi:hypothetical protein
MWSNRLDPHSFDESFKRDFVKCVIADFSIGKNSTILCFKLCVILHIKYFGTVVLANLERFPMVNNSKHLTYMSN